MDHRKTTRGSPATVPCVGTLACGMSSDLVVLRRPGREVHRLPTGRLGLDGAEGPRGPGAATGDRAHCDHRPRSRAERKLDSLSHAAHHVIRSTFTTRPNVCSRSALQDEYRGRRWLQRPRVDHWSRASGRIRGRDQRAPRARECAVAVDRQGSAAGGGNSRRWGHDQPRRIR